MKVLITGGAGYIGNELLELLNENEAVDKILIYDNLSRPNRNLFIGAHKLKKKKIQFVQGDLLDSRKLRKSLQGVEVVYHLAAKVTTPFADQNAHQFEQVNHWGTAELVYAIEESQVKRLVHLSSVSVYGSTEEKVSENAPLNPRTFYGISKKRGEDHVLRLAEKKEVYIIRCGNVYGYNKSMRFDAVINRFMFEANYSGRITINGSGEQSRPFVHIRKAAHVLDRLLNSELSRGTYNLVEHNMPVGAVVAEIRKLYPDLEMLFIDQHMKMRELQVKPSADLEPLIAEVEKSFHQEMEEFGKAFTF